MRAWRVGLILVVLVMVMVGVAVGQSGVVDCGPGQSVAEAIVQGATLRWRCDVSTATETATSTETITNTETPEPTETLQPIATATSTTGKTPTVALPAPTVTPFVSAPMCPQHFDTRHHALWDGRQGCHYTHTHHWDPALVDDIFGSILAVLGQEIGFPWETPKENEKKHTGYRFAINRNLSCRFDFASELEVRTDIYCVRAFRLQHHNHAYFDPLVRFHSFFVEMQICLRDGSACWILRTGGWGDFGHFMAPYKVECIGLPTDPVDFQCGVEGYRAFNRDVFGGINFRTRYLQPFRACKGCPTFRSAANDNVSYWATMKAWSSYSDYNQSASFIEWTYDTAMLVHHDPLSSTLPSLVPICPDGRCRFNGSEAQVYQVAGIIHQSLDAVDGTVDGWVRGGFTGWTNRKGQLVTGCAAMGLDCIPYQIVGDAKIGMGFWSYQQDLGYTLPQPDGAQGPPEFDVSPGDVWWIEMEHH